ncbi:MAG: type II secretion system F family protein [Actinomycetota bacterium]
MSGAFCWLAGAIWLSSRAGQGDDTARTRPKGLSRRALQSCGCAATALFAVLVAGPVVGIAVTAVLAPLIVATIARLDASSRRAGDARHRATLPLVLDLMATVLRSGQPVQTALLAAAPAADSHAAGGLAHVAALLRLGAAPSEAWRTFLEDPVLAPVARTACRSADSGIRLAGGLERLAVELRADARAAAQARAHRAGVWAMAPLGLCFLPAFVCVGVVPVVAGVARGVFTGLGP